MGRRTRVDRSGGPGEPGGAVRDARPKPRGEVTRMADGIRIKALNARFGAAHIIRDIDLTIAPVAVTAIIGPSGCRKSTLVPGLNRVHAGLPDARVSGSVMRAAAARYAPAAD